MDGLDDIVEEFLVESHENLDQLDTDLVALEQEPNSRERLSSIFRTIHTIKGTSGFLAFNRLEEVTHVGENMLSRLRDGELELTPTRTSVLLQMVDTVRSLLTSIEASGGEGPVDVSAVVAAISAAMEDTPAPPLLRLPPRFRLPARPLPRSRPPRSPLRRLRPPSGPPRPRRPPPPRGPPPRSGPRRRRRPPQHARPPPRRPRPSPLPPSRSWSSRRRRWPFSRDAGRRRRGSGRRDRRRRDRGRRGGARGRAGRRRRRARR